MKLPPISQDQVLWWRALWWICFNLCLIVFGLVLVHPRVSGSRLYMRIFPHTVLIILSLDIPVLSVVRRRKIQPKWLMALSKNSSNQPQESVTEAKSKPQRLCPWFWSKETDGLGSQVYYKWCFSQSWEGCFGRSNNCSFSRWWRSFGKCCCYRSSFGQAYCCFWESICCWCLFYFSYPYKLDCA